MPRDLRANGRVEFLILLCEVHSHLTIFLWWKWKEAISLYIQHYNSTFCSVSEKTFFFSTSIPNLHPWNREKATHMGTRQRREESLHSFEFAWEWEVNEVYDGIFRKQHKGFKVLKVQS